MHGVLDMRGPLEYVLSMPYASDTPGIYTINCAANRTVYIGQSRRTRKRIADHFNLLREKRHPNPVLQNTFNKYGEKTFFAEVEIECADGEELNTIENAAINGDLEFRFPTTMNIANAAGTPMLGRKHSEETKQKISSSKIGVRNVIPDISLMRKTKNLTDEVFRSKVEYIVRNAHLSYAERARFVGWETSTTRKKFYMYAPLYGVVPPAPRASYPRGTEEKLKVIADNPDKTSAELASVLGCSTNSIAVLRRRYNL